MTEFNERYETLDTFEEVTPSSNSGSVLNRTKERRG